MRRIVYILLLFLLAACNEDKGNYDYKEINTVEVKLKEMYSFRLEKDTTVLIVPELSQSLAANKENLDFMWIHATSSPNIENTDEKDTLSYSDTLRFHIDPEDEELEYEHFFRLNVYDHITDINYPLNTVIKLVKPYTGAWMILHNEDGHAKLGAVEYLGADILKTQDAYYKDSGKQFEGKGLCMGSFVDTYKPYGHDDVNVFTVFTDKPEESGILCQWDKFELITPLKKMIYDPHEADFDFSDVKTFDSEGSWGIVCLSGNTLYQCPSSMKLYKANVSPELGEVRIKYASKAGFGSILYDELGHRFCYYQNQERDTEWDPNIFKPETENNPTQWMINPIPHRDNDAQGADPAALPVDQKVLWAGSGYVYEPGTVRSTYAYGVATKGADSCFVYELDMWGIASTSYDNPALAGYYCLNLPQGMDENSCFAATMYYSGYLFYTADNVVYRLDFKQSGGKATPIYTHTGGKATVMKFAKRSVIDPEKLDYIDYEFDPNISLGIAFDMGNGKSDFVVLNLSGTGSIGTDSEHYPATQVHSDFGEIKDILFL